MKGRYELRGCVIVDTTSLEDSNSYDNLSDLQQVLSATETSGMEEEDDEYNYHSAEYFSIKYLNTDNEIKQYDFEKDSVAEEEMLEFKSLMELYLKRKKTKEIFEKILVTSPFLSTTESWAKAREIFELYQREGFNDLP